MRSILQHAWAEIEHDLGYKSAAGVPAALRRKFARIASLLELADDEFSSIRTALLQYEKSMPEKIRRDPQAVALDLPSFKALYTLPSKVSSLDDAVAEVANFKFTSKMRQLDSFLERLHSFGIRTVSELEKTALLEHKTVRAFAQYWINTSKTVEMEADMGIGVFYLLYVLAWRTKDRERINNYFKAYNIGTSAGREALTDRLMSFDPSTGES